MKSTFCFFMMLVLMVSVANAHSPPHVMTVQYELAFVEDSDMDITSVEMSPARIVTAEYIIHNLGVPERRDHGELLSINNNLSISPQTHRKCYLYMDLENIKTPLSGCRHAAKDVHYTELGYSIWY